MVSLTDFKGTLEDWPFCGSTLRRILRDMSRCANRGRHFTRRGSVSWYLDCSLGSSRILSLTSPQINYCCQSFGFVTSTFNHGDRQTRPRIKSDNQKIRISTWCKRQPIIFRYYHFLLSAAYSRSFGNGLSTERGDATLLSRLNTSHHISGYRITLGLSPRGTPEDTTPLECLRRATSGQCWPPSYASLRLVSPTLANTLTSRVKVLLGRAFHSKG